MIDKEQMRGAFLHATEFPHEGKYPAIAPKLKPGGLVARLLVEGEIAHEAAIADDDLGNAIRAGTSAGDVTLEALKEGRKVELRVYDGDTGGWVFSRQIIAR